MVVLRRVVGYSMAPLLRPGQIVWGLKTYTNLRVGNVVIVSHDGIDKIKRIKKIIDGQLEVVGDNENESTDSRHFGRVPANAVLAKVIWPLQLSR